MFYIIYNNWESKILVRTKGGKEMKKLTKRYAESSKKEKKMANL